jgi:hypothetical protein
MPPKAEATGTLEGKMKYTLDGVVIENRQRLLVETDIGIFVVDSGKPSYPQMPGQRVKIVVEIDADGHYTSAKLAGT